MNKWTQRAIALGLTAALCLGGAGAAFAKTADQQAQPKAQTQTSNGSADGVPAAAKDETVYVLTDASGAVQKTIVSDWLSNTQGSDTLSDVSRLNGVENVKGDEACTENGDSELLWDAQGNDIYYQGTTEEAPPVAMHVTYTLDGKAITPQELAGKSGQVVIRFDYENRQSETRLIDGQKETVYVPFAVVTALTLDTEVFRNVEMTNGRLLNDGSRTVAVGLAFPGLAENLDASGLEIPDYVEIKADVTEFELGMTVTVATNQLFNQLNSGDGASDFSFTEALTQLTDGVTQLTDGSAALHEGLSTLLEQTNTLAAGISQLADGAQALQSGAASADDGAAQLSSGLTELSAGLTTVSANSSSLNSGAAQVFETLLATATAQLQAAGVPVSGLTAENYAEVLTGLLAKVGEGSAAGQTVAALKASLDSYGAFYQGLCAYTGGVDSAAAGAEKLAAGAASLKTGTAQLRTGASSLASGIATVQANMPALTGGVTQLRDGAEELSQGIQQLCGQVSEKLTALLGSDPEGFSARLTAMLEVSEQYQSFSGLSDGTEGQVKFIYRTGEIRAAAEN